MNCQCNATPAITGIRYLSIIFLNCQPLIHNKVISVLRLNVTNNNKVEVPAAELSFARVVVPDTQVVECSKWSTPNKTTN